MLVECLRINTPGLDEIKKNFGGRPSPRDTVVGARKSPIAGSTEGGETSRTQRTPDQISFGRQYVVNAARRRTSRAASACRGSHRRTFGAALRKL